MLLEPGVYLSIVNIIGQPVTRDTPSWIEECLGAEFFINPSEGTIRKLGDSKSRNLTISDNGYTLSFDSYKF